jgi:hypothetical protein
MPAGRVDVRQTERTGKSRLRFYGVADDQLEIIQTALFLARSELGTDFDTVALDGICTSYLATAGYASPAKHLQPDISLPVANVQPCT